MGCSGSNLTCLKTKPTVPSFRDPLGQNSQSEELAKGLLESKNKESLDRPIQKIQIESRSGVRPFNSSPEPLNNQGHSSPSPKRSPLGQKSKSFFGGTSSGNHVSPSLRKNRLPSVYKERYIQGINNKQRGVLEPKENHTPPCINEKSESLGDRNREGFLQNNQILVGPKNYHQMGPEPRKTKSPARKTYTTFNLLSSLKVLPSRENSEESSKKLFHDQPLTKIQYKKLSSHPEGFHSLKRQEKGPFKRRKKNTVLTIKETRENNPGHRSLASLHKRQTLSPFYQTSNPPAQPLPLHSFSHIPPQPNIGAISSQRDIKRFVRKGTRKVSKSLKHISRRDSRNQTIIINHQGTFQALGDSADSSLVEEKVSPGHRPSHVAVPNNETISGVGTLNNLPEEKEKQEPASLATLKKANQTFNSSQNLHKISHEEKPQNNFIQLLDREALSNQPLQPTEDEKLTFGQSVNGKSESKFQESLNVASNSMSRTAYFGRQTSHSRLHYPIRQSLSPGNHSLALSPPGPKKPAKQKQLLIKLESEVPTPKDSQKEMETLGLAQAAKEKPSIKLQSMGEMNSKTLPKQSSFLNLRFFHHPSQREI